jgi:hypothetical protein
LWFGTCLASFESFSRFFFDTHISILFLLDGRCLFP